MNHVELERESSSMSLPSYQEIKRKFWKSGLYLVNQLVRHERQALTTECQRHGVFILFNS